MTQRKRTDLVPAPHGRALAAQNKTNLITRGLADIEQLLDDRRAPQPAQLSNSKAPETPDPDDSDAFFEIRRAAEHGDADAQVNLGFMYHHGKGVPQDDSEAVRWFRRAAEQDDATAQVNLGLMYYNGEGVPQDDSEAVRWFRRAAEQDDATAQNNLGFMYRHGKGVPQDDSEAVRWFRRAAEHGDADAQVNLGYMYDAGWGVPQDDRQAFQWYRRASEQGIWLSLGGVREDPMRLNDFWGIVERSRRSTDEETAKALVSELEKYTTEDVERFKDRSSSFYCRMPRDLFADLCRAATGYCSDDRLLYFCYGIIAAGRTAYEEIMANPTVETLRKHFKDVTGISGESFGYAPSGCLEREDVDV